jgi:raffinose/stachyose/melibiose transport system permease protein
MDMKKLRKILTVAGLSLFAMVQLYPLYWLFMFSLKSNQDILMSDNVLGWPKVFHWENYVTVLSRFTIPMYFLNSAIYSGAAVLVVGILTAMASYAIARMKWKLSGTVFMVFVVGIMIPVHAALLPLYQVLHSTGLRNVPYLGLILVYIAFGIPMSVMILTSFFKTLPKEFEEAAFIDGCSIFGTFWMIMLPLIMPAIATASIFTVMATWNDLLLVQTYVDVNSLKTITVGVLDFTGVHSLRLGLIGAGLVTATVPVIIIYILFSEKIQKSLLQGAIKA